MKRIAVMCLALAAAGAQAQFTRAPRVEPAPGEVDSRVAEPKRGDTVRPEVGKPLQAAQELLKSRKYAEALAKITETDAVANKTAFETFTIARMRGAVAVSAGNAEQAIRAFDTVLASGLLPAAEQLQTLQALTGLAYRAKNYEKSASLAARYFKEGGQDEQMRTLLIQSHYLGQDYQEAAKQLQASLQDDEKAGRTPTEDRLKLLATCHARLTDAAGYLGVLEKLVAHHPKKDYWADLLSRVPQRPGFSSRLSLDLYRLRLATGNLQSASDYVEMVQLALQESSPAEARKIVDLGFGAGMLGTGAEADRHKRLRDLTLKALADEQRSLANSDAEAANAAASDSGTGLYNLGWALYHHGQVDKAIAMMELGLRKGGLKRPEDAKLRLGTAAAQAGQRSKAAQVLKTVQGSDGTAELAKLWLLHVKAGM